MVHPLEASDCMSRESSLFLTRQSNPTPDTTDWYDRSVKMPKRLPRPAARQPATCAMHPCASHPWPPGADPRTSMPPTVLMVLIGRSACSVGQVAHYFGRTVMHGDMSEPLPLGNVHHARMPSCSYSSHPSNQVNCSPSFDKGPGRTTRRGALMASRRRLGAVAWRHGDTA